IDGGRGQSPVVIQEEENTPTTLPDVKKGYRGLIQEDESDSQHDNTDGYSSESDASSDEDLESESDDGYHDAFLAATQSLAQEKMELSTLQELLAEEDAGNIKDVFILMAMPSSSKDIMDNISDDTPPLSVLSAELDPDIDPLSTLVFRNDEYGFCLEAPKSRDILSDTPCRLVPGLEEHRIMVGDLPEVEEHIDEIQQLFQKH
ncbi:hypothetical protein EC968_010687, partial [Mortierella alpina]